MPKGHLTGKAPGRRRNPSDSSLHYHNDCRGAMPVYSTSINLLWSYIGNRNKYSYNKDFLVLVHREFQLFLVFLFGGTYKNLTKV
ncbi:hypothetical protein CLMAG_52620 [Clostridium magnum DSM 2767]|uniref:Uncharacterized protein n=1 Tax=Clostridium magnum DSM 2767 TaxID=1121326 RepID=A0A161WRK1_9CLOT|nr:hypothetical protein CLMAG_52620 [Clostridium magnum DSM 2767]SHI21055.1 hypothetical protein SAMN02745944_03257 [Clostridium magnum DSM 2767]